MKPKVKGSSMQRAPVQGVIAPKLNLPKSEPHVPPQLSEDTESKQRKKDKLAQLKLKKSEKIKQLLLQTKKVKKGITTDASLGSAVQQNPNTEHLLAVSSKIQPNLVKKEFKPLDRKTTQINDPETDPTDSFERVQDPLLRAEIAQCLRQRSASTVRVRRLPNRLRLQQITQLCNGIKALRVPWNHLGNRHKGVAFLEFASPEAAKKAATEISLNKALGCRLHATICGVAFGNQEDDEDLNNKEFGNERDDHKDDKDAEMGNVDAYDCRRVIVCGLHPHTTGQELKDLVNASLTDAAVLKVDFPHGCKQLKKSAPAVAYLTFVDERKALEAIKKFQGHTIRGRLTSWMLHKRANKLERPKDPTQLVAFGVSKRVTDEDLLKAFPNSKDIDIRENTGLAIISYANQTDCRTDFSACQGGVIRAGKAKLRVQFGHVNHVPASERRSLATESKEAKKQKQHQEQRLPRQKPPAEPKKPSAIDPSLFNKCQLIIKNFKPNTRDSDLTDFLSGARKVFFTPNRRLAFVHFNNETAASNALIKLAKEELNGAKLKAMYAMDKPDKKKTKEAPVSVANGNNAVDNVQPDNDAEEEVMQVDEPKIAKAKKFVPKNSQKQQKLNIKKRPFKKSTDTSSGVQE